MPVSLVHIIFAEDGQFFITIRFDVDSCVSSIERPDPALLDTFISYSQARLHGDAQKETEQIAQLICQNVRLSFGSDIVQAQLIELDLGPPDDPARVHIAQFRGQAPQAHTRCRWLGNPYLKIVNLHMETQGTPGAYVEIIQNFGDSAIYAGVPTNRIDIASAYTIEGVLHVLPAGFDHVLFILGLCLAMSTLGHLLWQVTAFTIAHTLTLGLITAGLSAPQWLQVLVEPCIALSIAFVACENCIFTSMKRWRPLLVFFFGLIHGMGFASVLKDLGIPDEYFWISLFSFNLGVEIAQLCIVALFAACCWWAVKKESYRTRFVIPMSAGIGVIGLYLFIGTL